MSSRLVVIDAGHSGEDAGLEYDLITERDVVNDIAILATKLLREYDYKVITTSEVIKRLEKEAKRLSQTQEGYEEPQGPIGPPDLLALANEIGAACYLVLHCNEGATPEVHGIETLYRQGDRLSAALAKAIQLRAVQLTGATNLLVRGVEEGVRLARVSDAAVQVNVGHLSNAAERELLISGPYQGLIAQALCEGIDGFLAGRYLGGDASG